MPKKVTIEEAFKSIEKQINQLIDVVNMMKRCGICYCLVHDDDIQDHSQWHEDQSWKP